MRTAHSCRRPAASARWARLRGPGSRSLRARGCGASVASPVRTQCQTPGGPLPHLAGFKRQLGVPLGKLRPGRGPEPALPACASSSLDGSGSLAFKRLQAPPVRPRNGGSASPAHSFLDALGSLLSTCWALVCDSRGPRVCSCAWHSSFSSFSLPLPRALQLCPGHSALYLVKL